MQHTIQSLLIRTIGFQSYSPSVQMTDNKLAAELAFGTCMQIKRSRLQGSGRVISMPWSSVWVRFIPSAVVSEGMNQELSFQRCKHGCSSTTFQITMSNNLFAATDRVGSEGLAFNFITEHNLNAFKLDRTDFLHDQIFIGGDEGIDRELGGPGPVQFVDRGDNYTRKASLTDEANLNWEEDSRVHTSDVEY